MLLGLLLTVSVRNAYAASFTAAQSGNWDDPATWGSSAPSVTINSADTVTIPNGITVTVPSGVTVTDSGNLNINDAGVVAVASGGTLTVNSGGGVTIWACTNFVSGRLSNQGTVNINSGGAIISAYPNCISSTPTVDNYGTFNINAGGTLSTGNGAVIAGNAGGTINNSGTISSCPANTFNNAGTLNNYNVINLCPGNSFGNWGTVNNYLGGTINETSFMYLFAGSVINDYGVINNSPFGCPDGIISNSGAIDIHAGGVLNNTTYNPICGVGSVTVNPGGSITVDAGGTLSNSAILNLDTGTTTTFSGPSTYAGSFTNNGTFTMLSGATLEVGGSGTGLVVSSGTLSIPAGTTLQVDSGASLSVNPGSALSNAGTLKLETGTTTFSGPSTYSGPFTNSGTFTMLPSSMLELGGSGTTLSISSGTLSLPSGVTLQLDSGAALSVNSGATLSNSGVLNNSATITNNAGGTITNNASSTFNNRGTFTNNAAFDNEAAVNNYATINTSGTLTNNATIKNYCGAVVTGAVTGDPVIDACVSVSLTSSASCSPTRPGQPITFTATVSPNTATGTVAFNEGATTLATSPLSGGTSTFTTSALSAGTHNITAVYGGDRIDVEAASAAFSQIVLPAWAFPAAAASLVDNSPGNFLDNPLVSGNLVAYSSGDGTNDYVKYADLTTGCSHVIPNSGAFDFFADVSGSKLVFTRLDSTHAAIEVFETGTPTTPPVELDPQAASFREDPQIGGNTVVWQDFGFNGYDIVVWDMATSKAKRLTSNGHINQSPGLSQDGSAVVWQDCSTFTSCNIFGSVQTSTDVWSAPVQLTTSGTCSASRPDTNGQVAVYSCTDSAGVAHVYLQPLGGGAVTQVAFSGSAFDPSISGGSVAFSGAPTGATSHNIYAYNIAMGTLTQVPTPPGDNTLNDISTLPNGQVNVVWQNEQSSLGIYAFALVGNFSLSPISPMTVGAGGSASTTVSVNSVGAFSSPVNLTASGTPSGMAASFSPNPVTPPSGSSVSSTLSLTVQPFVTPQTFTLTVTGTSASPALTHSTTVSVRVTATTSSTTSVINSLLTAGCIDNAGIANSFTGKLTAAQAKISAGAYADAINTLKALMNELKAQAGKHLSTSCTINGVTFNPVTVLMNDVQSLIDTLSTSITPNPITGDALTTTGSGISGATVSITDSTGTVVATATTDVTGFYFFANTRILTPGSTYTVMVTGFPTGFATSSPASQAITWSGSATVIGNFVLS